MTGLQRLEYERTVLEGQMGGAGQNCPALRELWKVLSEGTSRLAREFRGTMEELDEAQGKIADQVSARREVLREAVEMVGSRRGKAR